MGGLGFDIEHNLKAKANQKSIVHIGPSLFFIVDLERQIKKMLVYLQNL